ncbi:hypothetical protein C1H76_7503 [Elsinoe australis]|uniref:Transcription factor domain-containing protein n=1 Tax=Elsinoe australis TaxID=40998 RepID=A0A4U7AR11_9PEZI|nr:hypothetical protein C1H76_7503 [Elsinoe australis]
MCPLRSHWLRMYLLGTQEAEDKDETEKPLDKLLERLEKLESHISTEHASNETPPSQTQSPQILDSDQPASLEVADQAQPVHNDSFLPDAAASVLPDFPSIGPTPDLITTPFSPFAAEDAHSSLGLSKELAQRWLNAALDTAFFEMFLGLVDTDAIRALPHIIESPHVRVDASLAIVYYFLMFQGWTVAGGVEDKAWGSKLFRHCLYLAPDWTKKEDPTLVDFTAAAFLSWMGIENFDRRSAWKAHCQASYLSDRLGLTEYEQHPDEDGWLAENKRIMFWQLLFSECVFRIFYGKPAIITSRSWQVNLPTVAIAAARDKANASLATSFMVTTRLSLVTLESFSVLDNANHTMAEVREGLTKCVQEVSAILADWKLGESIDTEHNSFERWIYADVYIYGHSLIVFWERKIGELGHGGPSQLAVESSRKVLGTILKVSEADAKSGNDLMIYTGSVALISFYPMLAFFHLYNLILLDADGETSELDSKLLEQFAHIMVEGVKARGLDDVMPFAESIYQMTSKEGLRGISSPAISL